MPAVDQPDWQRYQSSTGTSLLTAVYTGTTTPAIMYVGPWRSWRFTAQDSNATAVWVINSSWYLDAAGTQLIQTEQTIIGKGTKRDAWRPIVGPYLKMTFTLVSSTGVASLTVRIIPSLLESLIGGWATQTPYLELVEQGQAAFTSTLHDAGIILPGPALLDIRANVPFFIFDILVMNTVGTFVQRRRYQLPESNSSFQYRVTIPDAPIQINTLNFSVYCTATYTCTLVPG